MPKPHRTEDAVGLSLDDRTIGEIQRQMRQEGGEIAVFVGGDQDDPSASIVVRGPLTRVLLSVLEDLGYQGALAMLDDPHPNRVQA